MRIRIRRTIAGLATVGIGTWVLVSLVSPGDGAPRPGSRLRIVFTGETLGELEPCDCSGEMAGGLPARGGYVRSERAKGDLLLVDTGCIGRGARDFERLRARATLRGMRVMGYHAVNLGEHELWLGAEGIREIEREGVPLISANVRVEDDGAPIPAWRTVTVGGLRVAVTGVVAREGVRPGTGLRVDDHREAIARRLAERNAREEPAAIVVLADVRGPAARDLATDFPEINAILLRGRGDSLPPERVHRTWIASVSGEARYVGDLELRWPESGPPELTRGEPVLLESSWPEDEEVARATIAWYQETVRGRTFDVPRGVPGWDRIRAVDPEPGNGYVGSDACRGCHPDQHAAWSANRHAAAMESLVRTGYDWSPECIVCHVTGYGAAGGYVSRDRSAALARVGCEACHGPGEALLGGECRGVARRGDEAVCRGCHSRKRHPGFVYEVHWGRIDHRGGTRPAGGRTDR